MIDPSAGNSTTHRELRAVACASFIRFRAFDFWLAQGRHPADWSWFVSLTVADKVNERRLHGFFREYCHGIATELHDHVLVWFAMGPQPFSRLLHVHGVLGLPPGCTLAPEVGAKRWRQMGYPCRDADVRVFDGERGGLLYTARHGEPTSKVACPGVRVCRRTGGCRVAGGDVWSREDYIPLDGNPR